MRLRVPVQVVAAIAFAKASMGSSSRNWSDRALGLPDPDDRTRLLGTLYVIAPATLLDHGDLEAGLELIEQLTAQYPDVPENHLRLAEAYITLHDPDSARPHLCSASATRPRCARTPRCSGG